ncbi:MAG: hypothetical protein N2Z62_10795 [Rhodobacteraceae bacterium]|nr:hypothetical protein [Paracoccaceae bacterium]
MRRLTAATAAALLAAGLAALAARAGDAGEALFLRGEGAEVVLAGGRLRRPASDFACAGCHGADGRGRREGGTVFPPILWSALTDPARPGGPYDEAALARALESGTAPDGRSLGAAMPRFALAEPGLISALARYLAQLDLRQRRGVTADGIALAPPADPAAARAFAAALAAENLAGGAWGRRFRLGRAAASLATAEEAAAALAPAIDRALAGLAAEALRASGQARAAVAPDAARLGPALAAQGVTLAEDAGARLAPTAGGMRLSLPGGRVLEIAPADTPDGGTPPDAMPGPLAAAALLGHEIARAALACGRGITRACLLETLGRADLAGRYAIRAAEPPASSD